MPSPTFRMNTNQLRSRRFSWKVLKTLLNARFCVPNSPTAPREVVSLTVGGGDHGHTHTSVCVPVQERH